MSGGTRFSRLQKYELCGGSSGHVNSALAMVSIINDRFSQMERSSIPQTPELTPEENKAYNSALNCLTTFWSSPAPPIHQVMVESRLSTNGVHGDIVAKAMERACEAHQGRPGFFLLKDFARSMKDLTGGKLNKEMAIALIVTRGDVQAVDGSVDVYSYVNYC